MNLRPKLLALVAVVTVLLGSASLARAATTPLSYHGGDLITSPAVYIDYWGSTWKTGFNDGYYTNVQAMSYITQFFEDVGGSPWLSTISQYSGIQNPFGQLRGTWIDDVNAVPPPNQFSKNFVEWEAHNAYNHWGGATYSAVFLIITALGQPKPYDMNSGDCGYHWHTPVGTTGVAYAYLPYLPNETNCYRNYVYSDDSFGHGWFDGFSIVGGEEYAEAVTDTDQFGWYQDVNGCYWSQKGCNEIGDMCLYGPFNGAWLGQEQFAVRALWSNSAAACVLPSGNPAAVCSPKSSTQYLVLATTSVIQQIYNRFEQVTFTLERIVAPDYTWCFQTHVVMSWTNGDLPAPFGSYDINVRVSCNHSIEGGGWVYDHSYTNFELYVNSGWHIDNGPCNIVWGADDADGQNGSQVVDVYGNTYNYWQPYFRADYVTYGTF